MRQKTFPSAERQWRKTVDLVESWMLLIRKSIRKLPLPPATALTPHYDFSTWRIFEEQTYRRLHFLKPFDIQTCLRNVWCEDHDMHWVLTDPWLPGLVRKNTRHFLAGDFVLLMYTNGMTSHPVWSVSSKGHRISGLYQETNRMGPEGLIEIIAPAGERIGIRLPVERRLPPWNLAPAVSTLFPELPILPPELVNKPLVAPDVCDFLVNLKKSAIVSR